ncbi:M28 family metallopeptidase [Edaphobacter modestus]|uniref:N-acetylated-alpha-linked acidic dipeptidase n=1 Tax=Edaphobacter modestus TaxID=388466 RepID=A0A4Q7YSR6_9BACT|nr:M28 family metallopeptidase [Edaphobacter modestus]RZU40294.1 N-acetylated-alpha-linked acidic dipeptidase [Edaphobacter modestus]
MRAVRTLASPLLFAALTVSAQTPHVFGYRDFTQQAKWDAAFLPVPDAALAGQHLKILTATPHWASSQQDYATAVYVADKFKAAGLETRIVPYRVLLNKPVKISIEAFNANGEKLMSGPSPEHVDPKKHGGDPFQDLPNILPAFNGSSPSGDVTGEVVYANYGSLADFKKLASLGISVKDKIVLVRYGSNFRGVKVYLAQQYGAKGVLIYSDPADDGYFRGDIYPKGPFRPESGVQRGSVQFLPIYPGDPQTPGVASTPDLPDSKRIPLADLKGNEPSIPSNPLSYKDAAPILKCLDGPVSPRDWQGALPFTYHLGGTSRVTVHMHLEQDTALRTIWDVIGTIEGTDASQKDDWVVAGNHRDAWVFGAVDPSSGTAAMLEAIHGLGELLKQGWRPKRRIVIGSWDAEEEGLIGSTEWAEQHASDLARAVAYFNTDVGVSGPDFKAAAVPSLKQFVREVSMRVPSPRGGTVYQQWKTVQETDAGNHTASTLGATHISSLGEEDVRVGDLGSGSDYTPFLQHLGVPSTDIGSEGPYGVYHSVFDNYNWFTKFADPTFVYEQQQARIFGLEILHMADADVLPYDYQLYGKEIAGYLESARRRAATSHLTLDFAPALEAARRFESAGAAIRDRQLSPPPNPASLNRALRDAETSLLNPEGLPHRSWYKHTIYAPGEYTGYAAVVIPGVNEAISEPDAARANAQLAQLTQALNRASAVLEAAK